MGLDFEQALKPYEKGGTQENPIRRTLGTICNALIHKNKIPSDVVGAVLLEVLADISKRGLKFEGNGSYGSSGREFFQEIRNRCIKLVTARNQKEVINSILCENTCLRIDCPHRTDNIAMSSRWNRFVRFMLKPRVLWRI